MITSILDTDLYKFTMQNEICALYPNDFVRFDFFNRGKTQFPDGFAKQLRWCVDSFSQIRLKQDEKEFLKKRCYYLNPVYLDFLESYRFNPDEVVISQEGGDLKICIEGPYYKVILWEVPLMATISQLYFEMTNQVPSNRSRETNAHKFKRLQHIGIRYSDLGTRRRFSYESQHDAIEDSLIINADNFNGTSNVYFAKEFDVNCLGTQAHEGYSFLAAKFGFRMANRIAMEKWVDVYQGNLGIALTDTFTTENFLKAFDTKYAKLFDGVRQDSGDPLHYIDLIIDHYKKLRIDPTTKTIVFSDSLNNFELIESIHNKCKGRIRDAYGIGTWLTNDVGVKPLNIVIKLTGVKIDNDWVQAVKLSDNISKNTGDSETIVFCKKVLGIK